MRKWLRKESIQRFQTWVPRRFLAFDGHKTVTMALAQSCCLCQGMIVSAISPSAPFPQGQPPHPFLLLVVVVRIIILLSLLLITPRGKTTSILPRPFFCSSISPFPPPPLSPFFLSPFLHHLLLLLPHGMATSSRESLTKLLSASVTRRYSWDFERDLDLFSLFRRSFDRLEMAPLPRKLLLLLLLL